MSETKLIHGKLIAIFKEFDAITKDKTNDNQGGFAYRGIDDVYNAAHPLFAKHGVFSTSKILDSQRETKEKVGDGGRVIGTTYYSRLHMLYRFFTEDGSSVETEVVGEGMDNGDKATNKAMAVAHKYAILQMLMVATEKTDDPDADTPAPSRTPGDAPSKNGKPANGKPKTYSEQEVRLRFDKIQEMGHDAALKAAASIKKSYLEGRYEKSDYLHLVTYCFKRALAPVDKQEQLDAVADAMKANVGNVEQIVAQDWRSLLLKREADFDGHAVVAKLTGNGGHKDALGGYFDDVLAYAKEKEHIQGKVAAHEGD